MERGFRALLLRGLLGGAVGGFVLTSSIIYMSQPKGWDNWFGWLMMGYVVIGLPYGVFIGGLVATAIWSLHRLMKMNLGLLSRVVIGSIMSMICWAVVWFLNYRPGNIERSWKSILLGLALFGGATGGIAGLIIGRQSSGTKVSTGAQV
jgi:hypothetical protein